MKYTLLIPVCLLVFSCQSPSTSSPGAASTVSADSVSSALPIQGTWRLITGTVITRGVPVVTDYTRESSFIKIRNGSHFAFLKHDLHPAKDSSNHFDAGGGVYTLKGDQYTEHLDYYTDKQYEGQSYTFTVSFHGDTLVQQGMEGADRENIERYVRVK
jgi:hypothetical protein